MLYIIITWIAFAAYIFAAWFCLRHFIHMFQLNSYKPRVQAKWVIKNSRRFIGVTAALLIVFAAFSAVAAAYESAAACIAVTVCSALCFAASALFMLPKKSYKTPLKYTKRAARLILTLAIIYLIPAVAMFISAWDVRVRSAVAICACFLWVFSAPWMVLLANMINRPLELLINRYYINDAKKILKNCPSLTVIGITGSFGKTSVKYFLDALLSVKYSVLKTPGNFNTPLGVVKTVRGSLRATHEIFLCEMGAKNVGDIKEICDIVHPRHGIITSVGPMHLESFKTIENVKKTKFELAGALPDDGMLFLNCDDENIRSVISSSGRKFTAYGIDDKRGYYADDIRISERGSEFTIHSPSAQSCSYRTSLIGRHNIINICGAIAVANSLGISLEELRPAVRRLESVPHRLQLINRGDYSIIDDAYNSNPSGTKAALEALSMADGMKILVTPGMIELGGMEYELNRQFGYDASKVCDYVALVGEKQTKPILDGLLSAGYDREKIYVAKDLRDAMSAVYSLTSGGKRKIILLENDLPDNY